VEDKKPYQAQIDYLITSIEKKIAENFDTKVKRVLQSGSWKKGTILKPQHDVPIDIDLIFFLDVGPDDYAELHQAKGEIVPILQSIYPSKSEDDFWENPRTAGLEFIDSGLNMDIVPVGKTRNSDYVAQPNLDGTVTYTAPDLQLQFISDRKVANSNYATIVRLLKKWRNFKDIRLSSFAIELIVAHLDLEKGVESNIQEALLRSFVLLTKKQSLVILFNAPVGVYQDTGSHVYIADPTSNVNNVVHSVTDEEWCGIRAHANVALDTLTLAEHEEGMTATVELWKEIFGSDFNINPIEE
jgi:hypothetical protein